MFNIIFSVVQTVLCLMMWFITFVSLRKKGCNGFMGPRRDKTKFDVVAFNRYAAKWGYLPLSILLSFMLPINFNASFAQADWYRILISVLGIIWTVSLVIAAPKIIDGTFEIKS